MKNRQRIRCNKIDGDVYVSLTDIISYYRMMIGLTTDVKEEQILMGILMEFTSLYQEK